MYSPLAQRFSADHRACVEVYYQSEVFDYAYTDMSNAGLDFYVKQPQLRSRLGQEKLDFHSYDEMHAFMEEAEAAKLAALKADDPIIWVVFGDHSGYWIDFKETSDPMPQFSDSWVTGFCVAKRKIWDLYWQGKRPCTKDTVMEFLQEWKPYLTEDLNGSLCEWRYCGGMDEDDYWSDGYLGVDEALNAALSEHPECRYKESDFDKIVKYRLKAA